MTPPRNYKSLLEEYVDRQRGMWYWIAIDPLNRTCKDYIKKFMPNSHVETGNLACNYASQFTDDTIEQCKFCFLDSNFEKCLEMAHKFYIACQSHDEANARKAAIELADIPVKEGIEAEILTSNKEE